MTNKEYEKYEKDCRSIRALNKKLLEKFEDYLRGKDLSSKTVKNHLDNIHFYINEFLLYYDANLPQEGIFKIDKYLSNLVMGTRKFSDYYDIYYASGVYESRFFSWSYGNHICLLIFKKGDTE